MPAVPSEALFDPAAFIVVRGDNMQCYSPQADRDAVHGITFSGSWLRANNEPTKDFIRACVKNGSISIAFSRVLSHALRMAQDVL